MCNRNEEFFDNDNAAKFCLVGIESMKRSRQTGSLLGREAPKHVPIGDRKVAYKKSTLLNWLDLPEEILEARNKKAKAQAKAEELA